MKIDYIPVAQGDLDAWEANFREKVKKITQHLGIPDAEVDAIITSIDRHRSLFAALMAKRSEAMAATSENAMAEKETVRGIRALSNRIKADKGYTAAMGIELGIVGSEKQFDQVNARPALTVRREGGSVIIRYIKGRAEGIYLHSRRSGEKEFTLLAVDTSSPYLDNRPNLTPGLSETREYKAWYFIDDALIGQESQVCSIIL